MAKRLQIQFYNQSSGESLSLPINPANVSLPTDINTQSYNIIDYGEIVRLGGRNCKRALFSNLFPSDNSFLNLLPTFFSNILSDIFSIAFSQKDTIDKLNRWTTNKDKIRVIVSDYYNELMQIVRFEPTIAENNETVHYTLEFIEYRDPEQELFSNIGKGILSNGLLQRTVLRAIPNSTYARAADDLYSISKRFTGSGSNWRSLAKNNGILDGTSSIVGKEINLKW